jgi:polysaccharide export outer membrane protein
MTTLSRSLLVVASAAFVASVVTASEVSGRAADSEAQSASQAKPDPKAAPPATKGAQPPATKGAPANTKGAPATPPAPPPPPEFRIGPDDVLDVLVVGEKDMSVSGLMVRPDGMITLPLVNDIKAAGLTVEELRLAVAKAATSQLREPEVTVFVRQINSPKVFVTGMVNKQGPIVMTTPLTVMQALTLAGGLEEFARQDEIVILRVENGKQVAKKFNYEEVSKGKRLEQNILLKPGDQVIVR